MENENPQEEAFKKNPAKKATKKKAKQATVLKQLNNQNLYPLQERIGIYVIAALSTIGLALITYTGVMAVVSSAANASEAPIDVDVDDLHDILDDLDLDDLIGSEDETEEPSQDEDDLHQYVEPTDDDDEDEPEDEETDDEPVSGNNQPTIGIINANVVRFWRHPEADSLFLLDIGDEVTIIELDYNAYWSHVEAYSDVLTGELRLWQGFVRRDFIDFE